MGFWSSSQETPDAQQFTRWRQRRLPSEDERVPAPSPGAPQPLVDTPLLSHKREPWASLGVRSSLVWTGVTNMPTIMLPYSAVRSQSLSIWQNKSSKKESPSPLRNPSKCEPRKSFSRVLSFSPSRGLFLSYTITWKEVAGRSQVPCRKAKLFDRSFKQTLLWEVVCISWWLHSVF